MIKLYNKTDLSYKTIGQVIDFYILNGKEDTLYPGKIDDIEFEYKHNHYKAQIKYMERDVEWRFIKIEEII